MRLMPLHPIEKLRPLPIGQCGCSCKRGTPTGLLYGNSGCSRCCDEQTALAEYPAMEAVVNAAEAALADLDKWPCYCTECSGGYMAGERSERCKVQPLRDALKKALASNQKSFDEYEERRRYWAREPR